MIRHHQRRHYGTQAICRVPETHGKARFAAVCSTRQKPHGNQASAKAFFAMGFLLGTRQSFCRVHKLDSHYVSKICQDLQNLLLFLPHMLTLDFLLCLSILYTLYSTNQKIHVQASEIRLLTLNV